jgi:hypothetical protein
LGEDLTTDEQQAPDRHEQIALLESQIEDLAEAADRCARTMLLAKAAIASSVLATILTSYKAAQVGQANVEGAVCSAIGAETRLVVLSYWRMDDERLIRVRQASQAYKLTIAENVGRIWTDVLQEPAIPYPASISTNTVLRPIPMAKAVPKLAGGCECPCP